MPNSKSLDGIFPKEFVEDKKKKLIDLPENKVEQEDIIEAEFLMKYGFEAYWALHPEKDRNQGITGKEMTRLLIAGRKIDAALLLSASQASFIGSVSSKAKNPSHAFKVSTQRIIKKMEADF